MGVRVKMPNAYALIYSCVGVTLIHILRRIAFQGVAREVRQLAKQLVKVGGFVLDAITRVEINSRDLVKDQQISWRGVPWREACIEHYPSCAPSGVELASTAYGL